MEKTKSRKLNISFESDIRLTPGRKTKEAEEAEEKSGSESKGRIWEFIAIATIPIVQVFGNSMLVPVLPEMQRLRDQQISKQLGHLDFFFGRRPVHSGNRLFVRPVWAENDHRPRFDRLRRSGRTRRLRSDLGLLRGDYCRPSDPGHGGRRDRAHRDGPGWRPLQGRYGK